VSAIGLFSLELDEATEGLEASEELHVLDEHVEFAWDDVERHTLVCHQDVVRNVCFDQVVKDNSCGVGERLLRIF